MILISVINPDGVQKGKLKSPVVPRVGENLIIDDTAYTVVLVVTET
jgi:hypothetical protein